MISMCHLSAKTSQFYFALVLVALIDLSAKTSRGDEANSPRSDSQAESDRFPSRGPLFAKIRRDWERRAELLSTVRFVLSGTTHHAPGSIVRPDELETAPAGFPVEQTSTPLEIEWLLDVRGSRFCKYSKDVSFNIKKEAFRPFVRREVFDGSGLKGHWPRVENTSEIYTPEAEKEDVVFWRANDLPLIVGTNDLPVFLSLGLVGCNPGAFNEMRLAAQKSLQIYDELTFQEQPCAVIRDDGPSDLSSNRRVTYYVSTTHDGAILRVEFARGNTVFETVDVTYGHSERGWMPIAWETCVYSGDPNPSRNEIMTSYSMRVDRIDFEPEVRDEAFQVQLKAGQIVLRRDANFKKMRVTDSGTLDTLDPSPKAVVHSRIYLRLVVLLAVNGLILALLILRRRGRRGAGADLKPIDKERRC
jgi:hypothetical protein